MSFGARELRLGMDVFSSDGVLLGSVVQIRRRPAAAPAKVAAYRPADGSRSPLFSGEAIGPMPTVSLGNSGPASQDQTTDYGAIPRTDATPEEEPADLLVFRTLVHLDWRTLWPKLRRYPVSLIQHVSHERIVLAARAADLP